ncbi:hypothetical protein ANO14919_047450 [Xylariales sp. No.14919]|nr:hypothetical protein ANO14919_047450 [Xylariales sp. No.14919]
MMAAEYQTCWTGAFFPRLAETRPGPAEIEGDGIGSVSVFSRLVLLFLGLVDKMADGIGGVPIFQGLEETVLFCVESVGAVPAKLVLGGNVTSGTDIDIDDKTSMKYQLQAHDQKIKAADSACKAAQATIQELRTCWQDGSLEMTRGQFQDEMKRQDRELGALFVERAHMRTSRFELAAREVDAEMWNKRAHPEDWAYIDQLVSRIQEPSGATVTTKNPRDPVKQERWRKDVIKAYGAKNDKEKIWCPISRQHLSSWMTTAAHIVRYRVGEPAAAHLFGPSDNSDGHIWSVRNGIPLCKEYEQMLDDARIAIVPTTDGSGLMVVILDEAEREKEWDPTDHFPTGKALHGRTLEFLTDHRPSMRYLYFAFVINILRRQRFEVDGWWKDRLEYADIPFFPTPGKWIRETTLRKLAVRIGHLPIDDAGKFATTTCRGSQLEHPSLVGASEGKGKGKETDIATDEVEDDAFSDLLAHSLNMDRMEAPEPDDEYQQ